jgi:hypothetical protein
VQLTDQVLGRHDHIVEEHLAELVIAGNRLDRSDPDPRAMQIDQQEADAGLARLGLRIGAYSRRTSSPNDVPRSSRFMARTTK